MEDKSMSNPLDLREIFYSNLLLLGFDVETEEANYRMLLNRNMFAFPNKLAMEIVCYFLFSRLDPQLAFQEFRDCWPIQDKKMEQQFRKSCSSWLTKIYKQEPDSNLPRIGTTLFLSPGGDRFYELMLSFSSFVLRKVIAREHGKHGGIPQIPKRTPRSPDLTRLFCKAMEIRTISEMDRFFEEVRYGLKVQERWKSCAASLTKEHRKLCKENRELERLTAKGYSSYHKEKTHFGEETDALQRTRRLQKIRRLWASLQLFCDTTTEKRIALNKILEGNEDCFSVDGSEVQLQIPDVLVTESQRHIQMKNIGNTYEAGKLSLISLMQLSDLGHHQLKGKIRQDGLPNIEEVTSFIKAEVPAHASHLLNAQNLRTCLLNEVIPDLKSSIEKLEEECYAALDQRTYSPIVSQESFDFGLGLLPSTPSAAYTLAGQSDCGDRIMRDSSLKKTPQNTGTPDVIENLTTSIREIFLSDRQLPDKSMFNRQPEVKRSVEETATFISLISKIPKPGRGLGQTPNALSGSSGLAAKSASTAKKRKKTKKDGIIRTKVISTISEKQRAKTGNNVTRPVSKNGFEAKKSEDFLATNCTTSSQKGVTSTLKKNALSAGDILAEKVARTVCTDKPSLDADNSLSQCSSGETTPKDFCLTDPVGNLHEEPFVTKDQIPRTPLKEEAHFEGYSRNFAESTGKMEIVEPVASVSARMTPVQLLQNSMNSSRMQGSPLFGDGDVSARQLCLDHSQPVVGHDLKSKSNSRGITTFDLGLEDVTTSPYLTRTNNDISGKFTSGGNEGGGSVSVDNMTDNVTSVGHGAIYTGTTPSNILEPCVTDTSLAGVHSTNSDATSPMETQQILMPWSTPCYSWSPIERKLTVFDINSPEFGSSPVYNKYIGSATRNDLEQESYSLLGNSLQRTAKSEATPVSLSSSITANSSQTGPSTKPPLMLEQNSYLDRISYFSKTDHPRTATRLTENPECPDGELFVTCEGVTLTTDAIVNVSMSESAAKAGVSVLSAKNSPLSPSLLLRYQQLKKAQENKSTRPGNGVTNFPYVETPVAARTTSTTP